MSAPAQSIMTSLRWPAFRPHPAPMAVACFLVGMCQTVRLNVIGEVVLAELLLPLLGVAALLRPEGRRVLGTRAFRWLLGTMFVTLAGYILSDTVSGTPAAQYLRGWGRMALVITAFISLTALAAARREHLWWFCAGMALGRILYLRLVLATPISLWKFSTEGFGYADPFTIAAAAAVVFVSPRIASMMFLVLGACSAYWDFRSQGLVCLVLAGFLWARAARPERPVSRGGGRIKLALLLLVALGIIVAGLKLTEDEHAANRRNESDIGRSVGKRFALKAIAESPLLGYGSWSHGRAFERMHAEALREVAGRDAALYRVGDSSSLTHAMVLQAWVEGGLLGIAFFVVLAAMLVRTVVTLATHRPMDGVSVLLLYFSIYGLWHLIMSPFAAPLRIHLALAAVTVVYLGLEQQERLQGARRTAQGLRAGLRQPAPPAADQLMGGRNF